VNNPRHDAMTSEQVRLIFKHLLVLGLALAALPGCQRRVVERQIESPYGEPVLAAGVLLDPGAEVAVDAIRARLADELPGYMIPRHVEILAEFPQLSSGKTDRKLLAATLEGRIRGRGPEDGPRATEARVREILEAVIGLESLDRDRCFLDVGGDSGNVVEVLEQIEERLGVSLDPRLFFEEETSTAAALGAAVHAQRCAERAPH